MAQILDGKQVAAAQRVKISEQIATLTAAGINPCLAIVLVGDDPASRIYAGRLNKSGTGLGMKVLLRTLPGDAAETAVLSLIDELNRDPAVHGILPMMPLPAHLSPDTLALTLAPEKDVDALHPLNAGLVANGKSRWASCTPRAVMAILEYYHIPVKGKQAVIIGRSNVVGKPLFHLLLAAHATVTVCHSRTPDLTAVVRRADIVCAAAGKAGLIGADMIKPGAVVIDVGINEQDGAIVGDVDYAAVQAVASAITPVPGGVGSVSTMMVMQAVLRQFC